MSTLEIHIVRKVTDIIVIIILVYTTCVNVALFLYCIKKCWQVFGEYKTCKESPNLHPLFKDVQYLSKKKKLYNLETHFVKYVLMVMCLSVEIVATVWTGITTLVEKKLVHAKHLMSNRSLTLSSYNDCNVHYFLRVSYKFPSFIPIFQLNIFLYMLFFILLSILTRYLAARYLNHPFRRTLIRYVVWLVVEFFLCVCCSTLYTFIFLVFLSPFLGLLHLYVLLRDYLILLRVLKSNLREIRLHYADKVLYKEQLHGYKSYRLFGRILIFSLFWLVIANITLCIKCIYQLAFDSYCILDLIYGMTIHPQTLNELQQSQFEFVMLLLSTLLFLLYSLSSSFPAVSVTIFPIIRKCVKRYKSRNHVYRYNYENMRNQPLLGKR